MNKSEKIKHIFKKFSEEAGFVKFGVAGTEPFRAEMSHLKYWLEHRYNGDMEYMRRYHESRTNVSGILPDAKSIIVVADNYYTPFKHSGTKNFGKISRYAYGDDYHKIVKGKLNELTGKIRETIPGSNSKSFIDTSFIFKKAAAKRAGIGWQGKNSLIISREYGSWMFIGIIITDIELPPDEPVKNYCSSCTRCMEACPTQAIAKPGMINATKCISYWTIETKNSSEISKEISQNLNGWLYGCDICQQVCPWNIKFARNAADTRYNPKFNQTEMELEYVENMTESDFSSRFDATSIERLGLSSLKRNARALMDSIQY